ncbi:MAG: aminopeptidase family protein P, partial [Bacteroidota bacterium]
RPELPSAPIFAHPASFTGQTAEDKIEQLHIFCQQKGLSTYLLSSLDDIAWLLNLRGTDVDCNPLFYSFFLYSASGSHLFTKASKVSEELARELAALNIEIQEYEDIWQLGNRFLAAETIVGYDPGTTPYRLYQSLWSVQWEAVGNPMRNWKAIKNETEIKHIRTAMRKDGVALTRLFRWLEQQVLNTPPTEAEVAIKLDELRRSQGAYHGESFPAIVGYQANGAIIHYRPPQEGSARLAPEGILLLDSGGQYDEGTTDITRTVALGPVTEEQKKHFTLVLKGHIALDRAKFPVGTTGVQLDGFARYALWQERLNYGHGTGHGVGFFLNVHEPPQGFATTITTSRGSTPLKPGMLTSNEPGYYQTGGYGIRIENLIICKEAGDAGFGPFLEFESLTLFPIDRRLMEISLLTKAEITWINTYHEQVKAGLSEYL